MMSNPLGMTDLDRQEAHGLYWEEIEKIVDGVEGEILDGNITSQDEARSWTDDAIGASEWVSRDANEWWCIHTLLFSQHAAIGFDYENSPGFLRDLWFVQRSVDGHKNLSHLHLEMKACPFVAGDAFPFYEFALSAMLADARAELEKKAAYKKLP